MSNMDKVILSHREVLENNERIFLMEKCWAYKICGINHLGAEPRRRYNSEESKFLVI